MADNVILPGTGATVETRDQGSAERQVVVAVSDTIRAAQSIVPSTLAYAAGNNIGGLLTFENAVRNAKAVLQRVLLRSSTQIQIPITLYLFSDDPSETFTDRSAMPALGDTTRGTLFKTIKFNYFEQRGGYSLYYAEFEGVEIPLALASTSLYAALEISGALTFAATQFIDVEVFTGKG